jgi:hypothetical protein
VPQPGHFLHQQSQFLSKEQFFFDQASPARPGALQEPCPTWSQPRGGYQRNHPFHTTKAPKDGNATNQKPKNSSCDNGHKAAHSDVYFAKQKLFTQHYALSGGK